MISENAVLPNSLDGLRVVIWGAGAHGGGMAAARYAAREGARVAILDGRPPRELPDAAGIAAVNGWPWHTGEWRHPAIRHADIVLVSPAVPPAVLAEAERLGVQVIGADRLFFDRHRGPRLAVTGTKGKSTTAHMCGTLLAWPVGGNSHEPLLDILARRGADCPVVCELSSFQLHHLRAHMPRFDVAVLSSLSRDHLDWHGSESEYRACKLALFESAEHAVVPPSIDDVPIGGKRLDNVRWNDDGFTLPNGSQIADRSDLRLRGAHNADNAAVALTAALHLGLDPGMAAIRLSQIDALPHRLQAVHSSGLLRFVDDSVATTPDAVAVGLAAIDGPIAVILGGVDKGADFGPLAESLRRRGAKAVCLGASAQIIQHSLAGQGLHAPIVKDLDSALNKAVELLGAAGGTVLLSPACASTDMFDDFAARGSTFTELARQIWPDAEVDSAAWLQI